MEKDNTSVAGNMSRKEAYISAFVLMSTIISSADTTINLATRFKNWFFAAEQHDVETTSSPLQQQPVACCMPCNSHSLLDMSPMVQTHDLVIPYFHRSPRQSIDTNFLQTHLPPQHTNHLIALLPHNSQNKDMQPMRIPMQARVITQNQMISFVQRSMPIISFDINRRQRPT